MRFLLFLLLNITSINFVLSQDQGSNWVLGYHNGINDTNNICGKMVVKFGKNIDPVVTCSQNDNQLFLNGNQATISDKSGQLLFYFDGYRIANSKHEIIENGDGINAGKVRELFPDSYPIDKGCLIIPDPENENKWYILHQYLEYFKNRPNPDEIYCTNIYYTVVVRDPLNNKLKVTIKNAPLLINLSIKLSKGHFNSVKHANGRDWWIITQELESSRYLCFLLTSGGIYSPKSVVSGLTPSNRDYNCNSVFSKDGSIYATCFARNFIQIFDFDRCSGQLSNSKRIYNEEMHVNGLGFIELSADNHYLYLSSIYKIWQYDLTSSNTMASEKVIGVWDTMYYHNLFSTAFYTLCRAPDDQIYASCFSSNVYLHKISFPNRNGDSCDFKLRALTLPEFSLDLPQSTNYNLGALPGSGCDSLSQTMDNTIGQIHVYPNPAQEKLLINNTTIKDIVRLKIYNVFGLEIANMEILQKTNPLTIDISNFENGTYFYSCTFKNYTSKLNGKFQILK